MAADVKVGNFTMNVTTGNQSVTGLGFQPKAVLFMVKGFGGGGTGVHEESSFGWALSSSVRRSMCWTSENGVTTSNARRGWSDTKCIHCYQYNSSTVLSFAADLVSMDSDGFTINVTTAPPSGYRINYLALGGTDLTNFATDRFDLTTSASDQAITGVGFQPDFVLLFSTLGTTNTDFSSGDVTCGIGMVAGTTKQASIAWAENNGQTTTDTNRYQRNDSSLAMLDDTGSEAFRTSLASFDSDGFTLQKDTAPSANRRLHYLAIKGGSWHVDDFLSRTSTGNFSETGVGFQAKAMFFMSIMNAASSSPQPHAKISLGAASSSTQRSSWGYKSRDNQSTSDVFKFEYLTRIYVNWNSVGTVTDGEIDFVSFGSDGFTLNQVDADPTANQLVYFSVGDTGTAAQTISPSSITSDESFGTPQVDMHVDPSSITSDESFGTPQVDMQILVDSIPSSESFGTPNVARASEILVSSIPSSEAFGTPQVDMQIQVSSIPSSEAFGVPIVAIPSQILVDSITSSESFGTPQVDMQIQVGSILSSESFGVPYVNVGNLVRVQSIPSSEAWGILQLNQQISVESLNRSDAFGTPAVGMQVQVDSILSNESWGSPQLNQEVLVNSIPSSESWGIPTASLLIPQTINVESIPSSESFGTPTVYSGVGIAVDSIPSSEAWGTPDVSMQIRVGSISSSESWGEPTLTLEIIADSIPSSESFGTPSVSSTNQLLVSSITSSESFGTPTLIQSQFVFVGSIPSSESWGTPSVSWPQSVLVESIPSSESFGQPILLNNRIIEVESITSTEAWGNVTVIIEQFITIDNGIPTSESWGTPTVSHRVLNQFQRMMEDDLEEGFFNDEEFADSNVLIIYPDGSSDTVSAIFDNEYYEIDAGAGAPVMGRAPTIWMQESKYKKHEYSKGCEVRVRGVTYRCIKPEPDGTGLLVLDLHHQETV